MSDNIEKRAYELHWTHANGDARRAMIDVTINLDYEAGCVHRVRAYSPHHGYVWSATVYVAVMRMACEVLRRENVATFRIERDGDEFPAMVPPCASFDNAKLYALTWPEGDASRHVEPVTVHHDPESVLRPYYTETTGRSCDAQSPIVALYDTACEMLYRTPVETFSIVEAS